MAFVKAPEAGTLQLIIVTALITGLITAFLGVFGKKAFEFILDVLLKPIHFASERIYQFLAPRNPFSLSLRSYRKHISRSNLTRIENPVGPNLSVPLQYAFAPLKLISTNTQDTVDLFSHVAVSHRCIVLGGPGTGKTTLMKSLVTSVINGRSAESLNDLIPVFVVLRNLAKKGHSIEEAIVSTFADYHFPGAEKFVESALSQGRMLIVLDGLDEVGVSREFVAEQIAGFCERDNQQEHRNRVIVTCREYSYRTRDLQTVIPEIVRVEPFANHHMRVFLQGWPMHKGRLAIRLYTLIQNDPHLRDICRNPLLLTILTGLYLDTDNFELPTSRERFYKAAIEELLIQRPARRQIKQEFDADDKRKILERVALERLETAGPHEDAEELAQYLIQKKAADVFKKKDFDARGLIKELVDINGIIRPANDDTYTCAHRTIQEYFAAREARRTREPREVVQKFGSRAELIEVVYFYCGLIENLPALTMIVSAFISKAQWFEAGRCLLHTREALDTELIDKTVIELRKQIRPDLDFTAALELISSLAQRKESQFEATRNLLSEALNELTERYGGKGASALESTLATSPEAAMKVIPNLLRHRNERWRTAAVRLLRDIGTEEALDELVQLLTDKDPYVRTEAGRRLAELMESRPRDLENRAELLPERKDPEIWPLDEYFPSRLAIPIAEALKDVPGNGNVVARPMDCAVAVLRIRQGNTLKEQRQFIRRWRHVARDLRLEKLRQRTGALLQKCAVLAGLIFAFIVIGFSIVASYTNRIIVLSTQSPYFSTIATEHVNQVCNLSSEIVGDIKGRFPPNASGLARIWPSNWITEPVLPADKIEAFNTVAELTTLSKIDPYVVRRTLIDVDSVSVLTAEQKIGGLRAAINALENDLPPLNGSSYLLMRPERTFALGFFIIAVVFVFFGMQFLRRRHRSLLGSFFPVQWFGLTFLLGFTFSQSGMRNLRFAPLCFILGAYLSGTLLVKLPRPNKKFLKVVDDMVEAKAGTQQSNS